MSYDISNSFESLPDSQTKSFWTYHALLNLITHIGFSPLPRNPRNAKTILGNYAAFILINTQVRGESVLIL